VALPQVSIVATPETSGVHWKTRSGAVALVALQLPVWVLAPLVVPVTVPPSGGRMVAVVHASAKLAV